jgi:tetratricopeptide (TPR) repeat protein
LLCRVESPAFQLEINGNLDYRKLLTCIGSLNETDPENIELTVMKAIISNEKGNNYRALGMHDNAINAFINSLNLQTESYSTLYHANVAYTHRCLGKSFEEKEMHHEALERYKRANSIAEIIYRDEYHPEAIEIKAALNQLA